TAILSRYGSAWASETGGKLEIVGCDVSTGSEAGSATDLWIIPPARMPYWANAGKLRPIPPQAATADKEFDWENILPVYRNKLLTWDQQVYALPLLGDELFCFYRQDLFQDSQHRAAFKQRHGRDLSAPATWQEYAEIAEYFNGQCRPGLDRPCCSLPPLP